MHWRRTLLLSALMAAASSCHDEPQTCEDAGVFPGFGRLKPRDLHIEAFPLSSCVSDERTKADFTNHVQLTSDGTLTTVEAIDMHATWDSESNSLWLYMSVNYPPQHRALKIEIDASALPEGQPQQLPVNIGASGRSSGRWTGPEELMYVRAPEHSPALRSLLAEPLATPQFDYQAKGTLQLTRAAGRVRGTLELMLTGLLGGDPALKQLSYVACFDEPVAERRLEVDPSECGVGQIDLQGTPDCGIQTMTREYGGCRRVNIVVNTRVDAVTRCVREKLAGGLPFHVRVDIPTVDSTFHVMWVRGADGVMTRYTSYRTEPGLSARRCSLPRVSEPVEGFEDELIECDRLHGERRLCSDDKIFID